MEERLRTALKAGQFELYYQPAIFRSRAGSSAGAEALLRWNDPEGGWFRRPSFCRCWNPRGLIVDVGDWVMVRAAQDLRRGSVSVSRQCGSP